MVFDAKRHLDQLYQQIKEECTGHSTEFRTIWPKNDSRVRCGHEEQGMHHQVLMQWRRQHVRNLHRDGSARLCIADSNGNETVSSRAPIKTCKVEDFPWLSNKEEGGPTSSKGINSARVLLKYV